MTKDLLLFYVSWSREAFEHILLKFQGLGENKKQKNKKTKKKRRVILFFFNFSLVTLFVYISNVIPIPSFPPSPVSMRCSHPPTPTSPPWHYPSLWHQAFTWILLSENKIGKFTLFSRLRKKKNTFDKQLIISTTLINFFWAALSTLIWSLQNIVVHI
jgi:hypothetical protein